MTEMNPELIREKNETVKAFRKRCAKWKGLGMRKKGSAKAQNIRDRPGKAASGICLVCGLNRLKCICSGHMSEDAKERLREEQKKALTPKQSGYIPMQRSGFS